MSDVQQFNVDPEAHEAAARGDIPYVSDEAKAELPEDVTVAPDPDAPSETEETAEAATEETPAEPADDKPSEDPEPTTSEEPTQFQQWFTEFQENGELSEESRQAVVDTIFHPDLDPSLKDQYVNQFLGGLQATAGMSTLEAWGYVGGQDEYQSMVSWAKDNLSADEITAFDSQVIGGGTNAKVAIEGLHARFQQSGMSSGSEPDLSHNSDALPGSDVPEIHSKRHLAQIAGSEKYKNDPSYRAQIAAKVKAQHERHGPLKPY